MLARRSEYRAYLWLDRRMLGWTVALLCRSADGQLCPVDALGFGELHRRREGHVKRHWLLAYIYALVRRRNVVVLSTRGPDGLSCDTCMVPIAP
jgi:hypothetical protein